MLSTATTRVLLVHPRFNPNSFWNYQETCRVVGARYPAAPLGLITVAALLPASWPVRLIDCNVAELSDADLDQVDLVLLGGMLPQQRDLLRIIERAHARGKKVVVGGPDATSSPHVYRDADFLVLGEAEDVMAEFLAAWSRGETRGVFQAKESPDISRSPVPRFDLLRFEDYLHVGVQYSRGCPFNCEFCDIIELYGRVPRVKSNDQILAELDALYRLGYRGHVDFVDDNLIGNKKALKSFLPELARWLGERRWPFEFSTEATVNLADDRSLLEGMRDANFFALFVGIESPDEATLIQTQKKQNTRRVLAESIAKINRHGMFVNAGFIVGFDSESGSVAQGMIECIEDTAIPVAMVGLLYALPNTQLTRRLERERRLHPDPDRVASDEDADQCTSGLNFDTRRPRRDTLADFREVLARVYEPRAYFGRVARAGRLLDCSRHRLRMPLRHVARDLRSFVRMLWRMGLRDPRTRRPWWHAMVGTALTNPRALKPVASMAALYLHLGPFAEHVRRRLDQQIAALDDAAATAATLAQPA